MADAQGKSNRDLEKKLNQLKKQMMKLSGKRDAGKLDDIDFYREYFPLQEQSLQLQQELNAGSGSYRPR
ncbi:MAG: hypothetical protein WEB00_08025 [Dehalococcoidia bacterium]